MSLAYWYPSDLADLRRLFEDTEGFHRRHPDKGSPVTKTLIPKMDLVENETSHTLAVELPGFKKEDVNISLDNNRLTVAGEASASKEYEEVRQGDPPFAFLHLATVDSSRSFYRAKSKSLRDHSVTSAALLLFLQASKALMVSGRSLYV